MRVNDLVYIVSKNTNEVEIAKLLSIEKFFCYVWFDNKVEIVDIENVRL
jgi:hypothetical protein